MKRGRGSREQNVLFERQAPVWGRTRRSGLRNVAGEAARYVSCP